jgi:hypothetical protein
MPRLLATLCFSAALASGALPALAQSREPEPQAHEVSLSLDISVESEANAALVEAQYTYTPSKINRVDEVVPILRRFVRHPSAVWLRILRFGYTREPVTGGSVGGVLHLGPAYVGGDVGVQHDVVDYDRFEHAYWAAPFSLEAGLRPMEGLSVGAFYSARPVISTVLDDRLGFNQAERDGNDQRIGGRLAYSTPTDRVYATLSGWGHIADWTFSGFHPGDVTIRGIGAAARVAFQITSGFSISLRGEIARDHWDNQREDDDSDDFVGVDVDREVVGVRGGVDVDYWHRGRYAFRFGLGGGFEGAPPTVNNRETGVIQIGLGVITRF